MTGESETLKSVNMYPLDVKQDRLGTQATGRSCHARHAPFTKCVTTLDSSARLTKLIEVESVEALYREDYAELALRGIANAKSPAKGVRSRSILDRATLPSSASLRTSASAEVCALETHR